MARPEPRELTVLKTDDVTPHMRRITLGGEGMASFPADQASAYIKLVFPTEGEGRPLMRTYTVRHHREFEIDVDFVVHDTAGPASQWALETQPGDRILVGGPGPRKLLNPDADWFLIAGDMTALPAISVNLALLPGDARGYAVIEVLDRSDIQALVKPDNVELVWVINPEPDPSGQVLLERITQLDWLAGQPAVWAATEFQSMRKLRAYFKQDRQVPKTHLYVSSYWKMGNSEDQHKVAKRQDADTAE
ncbi:siderophore-interacting protein [Saccharospirillum impatiens]|uniref:siderophore-interacting protein n=1 Tax=Saccharospirillum impatiens TaxID=169438 RepID=UPI0003FE071F|nr:siderophore-interacting protein [Saccharospirillum impatiens]